MDNLTALQKYLIEKRKQLLEYASDKNTKLQLKVGYKEIDREQCQNFGYFKWSIYEYNRAIDYLDYSLPCAVTTQEEADKQYDMAVAKIDELEIDCLSEMGKDFQLMKTKWGR